MLAIQSLRRGFAIAVIGSAMIAIPPIQATVPGLTPSQNRGAKPVNPPFGRTYDVLSQEWWLWSFMQPVPDNPTFPSSPLPVASTPPCSNGQMGDVWFLYGVFLPYTDVTCTVPSGKALFLPIVNTECSSLESFPFHGDTAQDRQACAKAWIDNVTDLAASVDGVALHNLSPLRTRSGDFSFTVPNNNILVGSGPAWGFSSADGYYMLLGPLAAGVHQIHLEATLHDPFDPSHPVIAKINATLTITVMP